MNKKFDKPWLQNQQDLLKRVAWVNIITQFVFPVAAAFTSTIVTAKTHTTFQNEKWAILTEPYILTSGETVNTIAKRYGLTVTELKEINQLRTFDKPFTALGASSEIDVPKPRNNKWLPFNYSSLDKASTTDESSLRLAEVASRVGNLLTSDRIGNNAESQLNNLAMGEANRQIQDWLGRYGTTRVQANIDSHGRLNGSQFDMLLPLYDTSSQVTFTQFGLRHIDKRSTVNIGLGQRHFFGGWMLGYNAFLDHDLTGDNTRFGLGAEYARNYLKLSANGYFRLSNWKESHLLTDYDERPANGFDLRVQGYIPALPQLGCKLVYEQYFGDEVGLINKDHRGKNPSALTAGINYTPIPLLTFGIDRRQDMSGGGETQFNMEVNYEIGTPWSKQIDPGAVTSKRTLQGSRYDLVDRNNQIVLEYRKREVISLAMENLLIGHAGDTKPLHISVSSKYGFKDIQWEAASLFANGGKIGHQGGTHYLLTLPKYQSQGNNTYTVEAVAYDEHGNASKHVEMQVQVLPAEINASKSTFTAKDKELLADGRSTTLLTLTLKNKDDKPIRGLASDIKLVTSGLNGAVNDPKIEKMKETQSGVYESLLTASEKIGVLKITPQVDGIIIKPIEIMFVHPEAPLIKNLTIIGKLEMGQKLGATYTFNANHGDTTDKSRYVWGNKGNIDMTKGHTIIDSGQIPEYTLTQADAGTVKEIAVQAQNALGLIGNTRIVDTSMSAEQGNETHDGGKGGTVRGLADNMTITVSADKVKKDEPITLKIKTLNHGQLVRNVAVRVKAIKTVNRHNDAQKTTVLLNGASGVYQDFTDDQGMLSITVTDPNGLGVKTTLSVSVDGTAAPQTQDVIFTVATSPDVAGANFWGHMAETAVGANGAVFSRPRLLIELQSLDMKRVDKFLENGELWPRRVYKGAEWYCKRIHGTLPTKDDLMSLYTAHINNTMHDLYGWPQHRSYRSATPGTDQRGRNAHYAVNIDEGFEHVISEKVNDYVICKQ
ncbi:inverse autotransporter beta domain-containing protein [Xenorhabdus lircayensis]|uniref:Inverse autotransporter beta domain-containing protein n=1 Tax=Xenorhabdus lircayensis TaxID=2763499 RepID=A0ABS0U621_9GAMM|nr:inverse autotransporter beta domain-containing protein [Xenorhabdus lircayensis]MBI6549334.1 inverse autotransporter beta domain-containing protein [Xenorhabdus lircayensis]